MSKSAKSVYYFGIYVYAVGLLLLINPNLLLGLFGLPEAHEVWIRVVGMLAIFLGFYYTMAAKKELKDFFQLTVYTRSVVIFFFTAFVVLGLAPYPLLLFGVVDLLAAIWTQSALKSEK